MSGGAKRRLSEAPGYIQLHNLFRLIDRDQSGKYYVSSLELV